MTKDKTFIAVHSEWTSVCTEVISLMENKDDLWDKEKATILLIAAGKFLNKEHVPKKEATRLLTLCMDTALASNLR